MALKKDTPPTLELGHECPWAGLLNQYLRSAGLGPTNWNQRADFADTFSEDSWRAGTAWMRTNGVIMPQIEKRIWGPQAWRKLREVAPSVFDEAMLLYEERMAEVELGKKTNRL